MRYRLAAAAATVALIGLAACANRANEPSAAGTNPPAPTPTSAGPTPAAPTPAASKSSSDQPDLAPNGFGPYTFGARLVDLQARKLVTEVEPQPTCAGLTLAKGTADYEEPSLVFFNGELQYLTVDTPLVRTTEGARVGMPIGQVQAKYPDAATLNSAGGGMALLAKDSSGKYALLFRIRTAGTVESIEAGLAETLEFRFTEGEGC
jgi:hypothetical protein